MPTLDANFVTVRLKRCITLATTWSPKLDSHCNKVGAQRGVSVEELFAQYIKEGLNIMLKLVFGKTAGNEKITHQLSSEVSFSCPVESVQGHLESSEEVHKIQTIIIYELLLRN